MVSYHTMNFFKQMAKALKDEGHEVRVLAIHKLPFGAKEDGFDTHQCDWHLFDWGFIERYNPDRVIIFNGYFKPIHAASMILKERYNTLFAEVAWLPQNDFIYLDKDILHKTLIADHEVDLRSSLTQNHKDILNNLKSKYAPSTEIPYDLPEEYILLPLQLERDTSIVYGSGTFKDMNSVIGYVRNNSKGIPLVVKTHPKQASDKADEVLNLDGVDIVISKTDISMNDLAYRATLVCGINSTSIMEGLIHHKPTLQFGDNVVHRYNQGPFYNFSYYSKFNNSVAKAFNRAKLGVSPNEAEYMDRSLLHLWANQIDFRDPPRWAIEKILNYNTSVRSLGDIA